MSENTSAKPIKCVELPDELWTKLLEALPNAAGGYETSIRLFDGQVLERLIITNRGSIAGREAEGLAGYHGTIDNSVLTFGSDDIEAIQVPAFSFWQRPKWIALNPDHPARLNWQNRNGGMKT
jgi:hypothetical protein